MLHIYQIKMIVLFLALPLFVQSQESLKGQIFEVLDGKEIPLEGANVYWQNTTIGTMTDADGTFSVPYSQEHKQLVISFIGFKTKTLTVLSGFSFSCNSLFN